MVTPSPVGLVLAQTLSERGLVGALVGELQRLRSQLEVYIGEGNTFYLLGGVAALLLWYRFRRTR